MAYETNQTPNLYALLIGIDCYLPNLLPDGSYYKNLSGCVRDITHVEAFLKNTLKVPEQRILKLTASGASEPPEPRTQWPTYENMVVKFKELTVKAQAGEQVYIHYSGHGGRAKTIYHKLKGDDGIDEALVPTDIGNSTARYLRDIELAKLLKEMVDKGLVVTLVLDSCHSGGATRGGDSDIRGLDKDAVDGTPRNTESLVASHEELETNWLALTGGNTRKLSASGWLPESNDYVLLAACRQNEYAYEYAFDGKQRNGALTYWLLDTLQQLGAGNSYKVLHDRIFAKVHSKFQQQTPMLQGAGNRVIFGSDRVSLEYTATVLQVDLENKQVLLDVGQVHGLRKGAEFAIYSSGTTDFTCKEKRLALAEITQYGATKSWAKIEQLQQGKIEDGAPAVLLSASVNLIRKVRLFTKEAGNNSSEHLPPEIKKIENRALQAISNAIVEGKGWVEFASEDEAADYQVSLNKAGEYEICDPTGTPIRNLRPSLKADDPKAASTVVKRLVHLTKYKAVQELDNHDQNSPFAGKLVVEVLGKAENYDSADPIPPKCKLKQFEDLSHPTLKCGEWIFISIRNESTKALNIVILDLESDWAISQSHPSPSRKDKDFVILEAGKEEKIRLQTSLSNGQQEGIDILKVFGTVDTPNFRWLELPPLDQPLLSKGFSSRSNNPLQQLLAAFDAQEPISRKLTLAEYPSAEWTTKQITIKVKKS